MRNVFETSGVSEEKLKTFEQKFDEQFDIKKLHKKQIDSDYLDSEADSSEATSDSETKSSVKDNYVPQIKLEEKLFADAIVPVRNFEVKTKDMVLRINSKSTDIIDTRVIDGKKCLVIELTEDLTVNGIPVGAKS